MCVCVCQIFFELERERDGDPISLAFSLLRERHRSTIGEREILVALKKRQKHKKQQHSARDALKSTLFPQLKHSMFALSSKTSATPAFAVKKQQQNSRVVRATTTKAVVNDSPRIIVENDAETKKFRLRDHQREVIRDMSDFAGGEVLCASFVVLFFLTRARALFLFFSARRSWCASPSRDAGPGRERKGGTEREVSCSCVTFER